MSRGHLVTAAWVAVAACLVALPPAAPQSDQAVRYIDIFGGSTRFAIPPCEARGDEASRAVCDSLVKVLRSDLRFEALFKFVEEGLYGALARRPPDAPVFEDWRSIFATSRPTLSGLGK